MQNPIWMVIRPFNNHPTREFAVAPRGSLRNQQEWTGVWIGELLPKHRVERSYDPLVTFVSWWSWCPLHHWNLTWKQNQRVWKILSYWTFLLWCLYGSGGFPPHKTIRGKVTLIRLYIYIRYMFYTYILYWYIYIYILYWYIYYIDIYIYIILIYIYIILIYIYIYEFQSYCIHTYIVHPFAEAIPNCLIYLGDVATFAVLPAFEPLGHAGYPMDIWIGFPWLYNLTPTVVGVISRLMSPTAPPSWLQGWNGWLWILHVSVSSPQGRCRTLRSLFWPHQQVKHWSSIFVMSLCDITSRTSRIELAFVQGTVIIWYDNIIVWCAI